MPDPSERFPRPGTEAIVRSPGVDLYPGRVTQVRTVAGDGTGSTGATDDGTGSTGSTGSTAVVVVELPASFMTADAPESGTRLDLTWEEPDGIQVLPVVLAESRRDGASWRWVLTADGAASVEQRRRFVRFPIRKAVLLEGGGDGGPPAEPLPGHLLDLSEAALAAVVPARADDPRLAIGTTLACRFEIAGAWFVAHGCVASTRHDATAAHTRVVVRFELPEAETDQLRRVLTSGQG